MKRTTLMMAAIASAALYFTSCDTGKQERARLQHKVDSLSYSLDESKKAETALNEVGVLLDSIDASRHALGNEIVRGVSYADYINRLKNIHTDIKASQEKLIALENKLKSSGNASAATIRRLKADLESRSKEIVGLQEDVIKLREQNQSMSSAMVQRDSVISSRDEMIKMKTADVASLEGLVRDINDQNRIKVANLYFAQAQALEIAAKRTKFAPKKRKETKREALELYKLSSSMGNTEAQAKIEALEKELG